MAFNPDEPRDERGRWTGSGAPALGGWREKPLSDQSRAGRGSALAMHANLSMTDIFRRRPRWADPEPGERLGRLLPRWNAASRLDDETFRDRYLGRGVSLETVRALRTAARLAAGARTSGEMAQAGDHLASAIRAIGVEDWPGFLRDAEALAEAAPERGEKSDGVFRPAEDQGEFVPAQVEGGGEEEAGEGGRRRDGLLEEFLDPAASLRVATYRSIFTNFERLTGGVGQGTISDPDFVPSRGEVEALERDLAVRQEEVAKRIANGHADGRNAIARAEFPGISSPEELEALIEFVLRSPTTVRDRARGRAAFYNKRTQMLVIVDPSSRTLGSVYPSSDGVLPPDEGEPSPRVGETPNSRPAGVTYEGSLYRAIPAGGDPLDISYSVNANGRYTAPGQGGLYFASNAGTVEAEFVNNGSSLVGRDLNVFPDSSVSNLLDLTDPVVRDDLGVSLADLIRTGGTSAWRYEVTQPLGAYAQANGFNGIIAPSAQADGGVNLILFGANGVR